MPRKVVPPILMLLLSLAACGGDGDADGPGGALSKDQWIASANAICTEMYEQLDLIPEPQSPEEMGTAGARVTEIHRTALAGLQALEPPQGEKGNVDQILDAAEAVIDWGDEFIEAVSAGDDDKATGLLEEGERLAAESDRLFEQYGLIDCLESED